MAAAAAVPTEMNTYMFSNGKGKATSRKSFQKQKARQRVTGGDRNIEQSCTTSERFEVSEESASSSQVTGTLYVPSLPTERQTSHRAVNTLEGPPPFSVLPFPRLFHLPRKETARRANPESKDFATARYVESWNYKL